MKNLRTRVGLRLIPVNSSIFEHAMLITRRFTGQALGVAVICRQADICHIRDFIGNPKYVPEIVRQVRRMAGNWGIQQVKVWITDNFIHVFPKSEIEVKDMAYLYH